jgi:hypothetical protein
MIIIIFLIFNIIVVVDDSRYMSVGNSSSTQFVTGIKKFFGWNKLLGREDQLLQLWGFPCTEVVMPSDDALDK